MIEIISAICGLVIGAITGSFLNMLAYRLAHEKSLLNPSRSYCPKCESLLAWHDNIPLISYIILKGRCRKCSEKISIRYFLVEALLAAFGAYFACTYPILQAVVYFAFFSLLTGVTIADIENQIIPDEFTLFAAPLFIAVAVFSNFTVSFEESVIGAFGAAGALWLVNEYFYYFTKKDGLGFGDMKLFYLLGAFFGYKPLVLVLFFSCIFALVGYVFQRARKTAFGPYICAAAVVTFLYGSKILEWYIGLLP